MTTAIVDRPIGTATPSRTTGTFELQDKVVLLLLTLRAPGNERTVRDKSILNTDADRDRMHVSKKLLNCKEQSAISILDSRIAVYVKSIALPTPFKAGTHVIALDLLGLVDDRLTGLSEQRNAAVEQFVEVYDVAMADSRKQLGELFNEDEYLSPADLRAAYRMDWQYVTLTAPDKMKGVSNEIFERERARLQSQWDGAIGDMRDALRVGLSELVNDMVERLAGGEKKFKPTKLLERFDEFLGTFDARNVTNDTDLAELATQARALLAGVDTSALKSSRDLRERVRSGFMAAQSSLSQLETAAKGQRRITFTDE